MTERESDVRSVVMLHRGILDGLTAMAVIARLESSEPLGSELHKRLINRALFERMDPEEACDCARMLTAPQRKNLLLRLREGLGRE